MAARSILDERIIKIWISNKTFVLYSNALLIVGIIASMVSSVFFLYQLNNSPVFSDKIMRAYSRIRILEPAYGALRR